MEDTSTFRPDLLSILMADKNGDYYGACKRLLDLCRHGFTQAIDWETAAQHERDSVNLLIRVHASADTILERVWTSLHPSADDASQPSKPSQHD